MESTLTILRAAMFELCRADMESDMRAGRPDPDYQAHMRATLDAVRAADSLDSLAAVDWIQGIAAMGADPFRYDSDVPNI